MTTLLRWPRRKRKKTTGEEGDGSARPRRGPLLTALQRAREDVQVVCDKDPAVTSSVEVLLYPHLHALWLYRAAHALYVSEHRVAARSISMLGRFISGGIDIHPGARIGRRFFIDHGCGVVIGETARIGDDVMLYHLVTLGSVGWWHDTTRGPGAKRHPTVGDGVIVGTGACILGPVEVGSGSVIGAKAVVMTSLPMRSRIRAGQVVKQAAESSGPLGTVPIVSRVLRAVDQRSTE